MNPLRLERARRRLSRPSAPIIALVAWLLLIGVAETIKHPRWEGVSLCPVKAATGVPCPTCGSTRAVMAAAHGDLVAAFAYNPFTTIIVFGVLVWLVARFVVGWRLTLVVGAETERRLWLGGFTLLAANWIYLLWAGASLGS
jgi:hypothetical protein